MTTKTPGVVWYAVQDQRDICRQYPDDLAELAKLDALILELRASFYVVRVDTDTSSTNVRVSKA